MSKTPRTAVKKAPIIFHNIDLSAAHNVRRAQEELETKPDPLDIIKDSLEMMRGMKEIELRLDNNDLEFDAETLEVLEYYQDATNNLISLLHANLDEFAKYQIDFLKLVYLDIALGALKYADEDRSTPFEQTAYENLCGAFLLINGKENLDFYTTYQDKIEQCPGLTDDEKTDFIQHKLAFRSEQYAKILAQTGQMPKDIVFGINPSKPLPELRPVYGPAAAASPNYVALQDEAALTPPVGFGWTGEKTRFEDLYVDTPTTPEKGAIPSRDPRSPRSPYIDFLARNAASGRGAE